MVFSYLIRVRVDRNIVIGSKPTSSSGQLSEVCELSRQPSNWMGKRLMCDFLPDNMFFQLAIFLNVQCIAIYCISEQT